MTPKPSSSSTVGSSTKTQVMVSPLALSLQDISGPNNSACKQALEAKTTPRSTELSPRVALSNVSWPQREPVRAPA